MTSPWRAGGACPLCGCLAERANLGGREWVSCAACETVAPAAELERRITTRVLEFVDRYPELLERGPQSEERRVAGIADHLLQRRVAPNLAAELVVLWAARHAPRTPPLAVRALADQAAAKLLRRAA